jgi:glucose-6-phosphate dehydrogenase assembly protein OpcA
VETAVTPPPPPPTDEIERFTSGHNVAVDVAAIERDLAALWRKANTGSVSVTRACSWNLVVHTSTDAEFKQAQPLADALLASVPSRTVVLNDRPNATGTEIEAFVTANCKMLPGGGKLVCTEEITIEARGRGGEHLPSLLRALLVPDIPSAVLWSDLPPNNAMVAELLVGVDRVILDSTRATELFRVERLGAQVTSRVADLNWLRFAPLRLIIAAAFDAPADPAMLFKLRRVSIDAGPDADSSARLLIGWLGARLGWSSPERHTERGARGWTISRQDRTLQVELRSAPQGVTGVTFESDEGVRVRLDVSASSVTIDAGGAKRSVPFAQRSDADLVVAALGSRGSDKLYQSALHFAVELER